MEPVTKFLTYSEELFAQYLANMNILWDYEKDWSGRKPDFTLYSDQLKETPFAITDVKEIQHSKAELRILKEEGMLVKSSDPYAKIREKINVASKQFKYCKDYPCIPIICSLTGSMPSPLIVYGAMLGDITISIPLKTDSGVTNAKQAEYFGKHGKMIDEKHGIQNKSITAVGVLGMVYPQSVLSGFQDEVAERTKDIDINQKGWAEKTFVIEQEVREELIKKGFTNLDSKEPCVTFIVNPLAKLPFPYAEFQNGYTYIYQYDLETGEIKLTYDWSKSR